MLGLFYDPPEYELRKKTPFQPPKINLTEVRASIPRHLYEKSTVKGLYYVTRDVLFAVLFYNAATYIDPLCFSLVTSHGFTQVQAQLVKWTLWSVYWWWQGVCLAGWWCLGIPSNVLQLMRLDMAHYLLTIGLIICLDILCILQFIFVPYYSWRSTHHAHHKATGSIERDENYVPRTRADYKLPPASVAHVSDYHDMFEETPIYTLVRMLAMQALGWQFYLMTNALGSPMYPKGTNHFSPSSPLFRPDEHDRVVASNVGLATMASALMIYTRHVGFANLIKFYFIPYLLANHWIVMLTFLHHSDPTIPHYRSSEWNFLRGCLATVDRPLLGWVGRFFLHNVSHDHIAHHLFSMIPFYNQPEVTEHIKNVLKEDYNYDSSNTFRALYRSFSECCFIEDDEPIVFYKNQSGEAQRKLQANVK